MGTSIPTSPANQFDAFSLFQFSHDETPNVGGGNCCNDIVTALTNPGGSTSVILNGIEYIFAFTGFEVNWDSLHAVQHSGKRVQSRRAHGQLR